MRRRYALQIDGRTPCIAAAIIVHLFAWCAEDKTVIHGRAFVGDRDHPIANGVID